jgi:hypothetical protein
MITDVIDNSDCGDDDNVMIDLEGNFRTVITDCSKKNLKGYWIFVTQC